MSTILYTEDGTVGSSGIQNRVGIGTSTPAATLDVQGGESHFANGSYTDPAPNFAFDAKFGGDAGGIAVNGESVFNGGVNIADSITVISGATGDPQADRRNIQNAIDAAASAGGGTVILPDGNYYIQAVGGKPSEQTFYNSSTGSIILEDGDADFTLVDVALDDVFINMSQNWAGIITEVSAKSLTIGNVTDTSAELDTSDHYCIPGLVMKDGVALSGQSLKNTTSTASSTLTSCPVQSNGADFTDTILPTVLVTVDPSSQFTRLEMRNLNIVKLAPTTAQPDPNDIAIDGYNHYPGGDLHGSIFSAINIGYDATGTDPTPYHFSRGIRMASYSGSIRDCHVLHCTIGIDLSYPGNAANGITLIDNFVYPGGQADDPGRICVRISGCSNRIIGGCIGTLANSNVTLVDLADVLENSENNYSVCQNNIIGVYFDGPDNSASTTGNVAVNLDSNSMGNIVSGCHLDSSFSGTLYVEDPAVQGQNTFLSNGSNESSYNLPGNIAGQLGISYPTVFNSSLYANLDPLAFDITFLQNSGKMLVGWNRTASEGETDFMANRSSVLYTTGGFAFYDVENDPGPDGKPVANQLVRIMGNGSVGIGTPSPDSQLDVRGTLTIQNTAGTNSNDIVIKRPGAPSADNLEFVLSERNDNATLLLFGYNGSNFSNFLHCDFINNKTYLPGNGIYALTVDGNNSSVGINNQSPANNLSVAGSASVGYGSSDSAAPAKSLIVAGSVGIGTTQPSTILDVLGGESHFANGPYTDPALNLAFDAKFGGNAGGIAVNGKSVFNGALGIGTGTTTPSSLLDVRGTLTVQNPPNEPSNDIVIKRPGALSASSVEFVLNERENNTTLFIYGYNGSTYKNFVEFDYLDFKTMFPGNGSTLVIDEANNMVGVGTATPASTLHVHEGKIVLESDSGNFSQLQILNSDNSNEVSILLASGVTGGQGGEIVNPPGQKWFIGAGSYGQPTTTFGICNGAYGGYVLSALSNGNVGIGTAMPASGFHIGVDAGGINRGFITLEQLNLSAPPAAPGTGKSIIYMRNNHLCAIVGTGNEVTLA